MTAWIDLTGQRFGRWDVKGLWDPIDRNFWRCECDCGKIKRVLGMNMRTGKSQSCGCLWRESITKHGMVEHPAYNSWNSAKKRCRNPNNDNYADYGGRGIQFSTEWDDFNRFWSELGPTWAEGLTLDRKDVNGNYEPGNCQWANASQQASNRRNHVTINTPKGRMGLMEASTIFGVDYMTLFSRLSRGWPEEELLTPTLIDRKQSNETPATRDAANMNRSMIVAAKMKELRQIIGILEEGNTRDALLLLADIVSLA